jgi:hypothetical protein
MDQRGFGPAQGVPERVNDFETAQY